MSMFCFLFPTLLPRIAAFTAFTQTRHFGALHETTSKAILAAGKETCFRNWINTPFIFFFSFRFVIMNFLPLAIIFVFYLPQVLPKSKNVQEIHADQETIGKISAADQPAVDILFLLDGSSSVGSSGFNNSKHFAGKLCDALDIDPDRVHVGLIQFTSTPCIEFPLDSYQNKQEVEERIQSTRFRDGEKNIKQALECILCKGFPGGRNSTVPEILFIISNGKSSKSTTTLATQLKKRGITIFTVEIKSRRLKRLRMLASEPTKQHMFSIEDADGAINGLYSALTGSIYNATAPEANSTVSLCKPNPCLN
nr:von Willebrand factor A domain-containing protein 2 isoform X2 [Anas platyrhynchos]|eukprot:XP_027315897.1 von Willebrand factor A domain-containing protein 2 isoform X1 [Anas platyrhynchos]